MIVVIVVDRITFFNISWLRWWILFTKIWSC